MPDLLDKKKQKVAYFLMDREKLRKGWKWKKGREQNI